MASPFGGSCHRMLLMRGKLPDISPSSGAFRATFPQRGKAFAAGWGHPALRGNKKSSRGRGGACPARGQMATRKLRVNRVYGFPLWGKLSPQVTDEGEFAGHSPLIRRASAPPSPKGEGFCSGVVSPRLRFHGNAKFTGKPRVWLPPLGEAVTAGD